MAFDGRLPELFASIDDSARVVPYLASCSPQAWAAAVGPTILWAIAPLLPTRPGQASRQLAGIDIADVVDIDGFTVRGQRISAMVRSGVATYSEAVGSLAP